MLSAETIEAVRTKARARVNEIRSNREKYDQDFPTFAADCLKIRPKQGDEMLLRLNAVQKIVHAKAEEQLKRTGKVRLLVLKARQPGVSTYVEGRIYWKTSRQRGRRAFILTHDGDATDNIFEMTERFHANNPHAPKTGASNAKELTFVDLDSGFSVATAGAKGTGRSRTIQYFHGSEVAHWPNAQDHASGALQAVPNLPGTEVWLESTANGIGGLFYNMAQAAIRGVGEFELLFVPWFKHDEYETAAPDDWEPPQKIAFYGTKHGLSRSKLYWCFLKNSELAATEALPGDEICWKFEQEYPATVDEAFRASRRGSFIRGDLVLKARRFDAPDQSNLPLIFGCDIAATGSEGIGNEEGGDQNFFIDRQGRAAGRKVHQRFRDKSVVSVANKLQRLIDFHNPVKVFIDAGGGGAQVYDILVSRGYGSIVVLVNFGSAAEDARIYANKRAEIAGRTRDWLADPGGAQIPDDDALDADMTATKAKANMNQQIVLQSKKDVRKEVGFSPDGFDGLCLTFSERIAVPEDFKQSWRDELDAHDAAADPDSWMTQ